MTDASIPSGKDTRVSQADGATPETRRSRARRRRRSTPDRNSRRRRRGAETAPAPGASQLPDAGVSIPIAGAREADGPAAANPEELLLAALADCFVNTWAIFLKKLQIGYAEPAVRVTARLEDDPAGGFRLTDAVIRPRVPAHLLETDGSKIAKSLELSERYCIVSKVVRSAMPVRVEVESV